VQGALVDDLAAKAFGGSTASLVMHALAERPTDPEELAQIQALLDRLAARGQEDPR
jgi:predicted transcriptional regulator